MTRRQALTLIAGVAAVPAGLAAGGLPPGTIDGWEAYVRATETRIAGELAGGGGFLAMDFLPSARAERAAAIGGQLPVARMTSRGREGRTIEVPDGMVHHWRGAVLVPGASLDQVLDRVMNPPVGDMAQDDVVAARVIERAPGSLRLFLRLRRTQLVTVVYNTEHLVQCTRLGRTRASSRSIATRIAEVADPATPHERERLPGEDRGFLWRLNAYWRYEQVPAGVLVECESVSLSRTLPAFARPAVQPMIDRVARNSMERTLIALRTQVTHAIARGD